MDEKIFQKIREELNVAIHRGEHVNLGSERYNYLIQELKKGGEDILEVDFSKETPFGDLVKKIYSGNVPKDLDVPFDLLRELEKRRDKGEEIILYVSHPEKAESCYLSNLRGLAGEGVQLVTGCDNYEELPDSGGSGSPFGNIFTTHRKTRDEEQYLSEKKGDLEASLKFADVVYLVGGERSGKTTMLKLIKKGLEEKGKDVRYMDIHQFTGKSEEEQYSKILGELSKNRCGEKTPVTKDTIIFVDEADAISPAMKARFETDFGKVVYGIHNYNTLPQGKCIVNNVVDIDYTPR